MVADSVGDVVGPDDVTAPSDIGGESRGSAREVNGDEFASGQQKAMVTCLNADEVSSREGVPFGTIRLVNHRTYLFDLRSGRKP